MDSSSLSKSTVAVLLALSNIILFPFWKIDLKVCIVYVILFVLGFAIKNKDGQG